jgi:hypothetical protein
VDTEIDITRRAVSDWKHSPRVADGVAVERPGMRVVLKFHLED